MLTAVLRPVELFKYPPPWPFLSALLLLKLALLKKALFMITADGHVADAIAGAAVPLAVVHEHAVGASACVAAGAHVQKCDIAINKCLQAAVTLTNITANESTTQYGIFAQSAGAITLNRVTAIGNTGIGTYLDIGTGMNVMILSSRFNGNGSRGLEVNSSGKITLNAVWANDNGSDGAYLDNDLGSGDVEILATLGENQFSFNTLNGLTIATVGNVKLNKITAQENGGRGVTFSNNGGTGTVTITTLLTKMNGSYGLYFYTSGAATLTNVTSLSNGVGTNSDGMYVNSTSASGVKIINSFFLGNEGSGIEADLNAANLLTLVNTAFWGNDANNSGDLDKNVY